LYIEEDLMLDVMNNLFDCSHICLPDLSQVIPKGATVGAVQYSYERRAFAFRIHHKSFDQVHPGMAIPTLECITGKIPKRSIKLKKQEDGSFEAGRGIVHRKHKGKRHR